MNEKQDPKGEKRSPSWYTSGLMLTTTLDDFWKESSRHEQVVNHIVKLFNKFIL